MKQRNTEKMIVQKLDGKKLIYFKFVKKSIKNKI